MSNSLSFFKHWFYITLVVILAFDLGYSFLQHYSEVVDGDLARITLSYEEVLNDPFGMKVVLEGKHYPNPNRYFAHLVHSEYFKKVPLILQSFFDPIESIYISCALLKLLIQIGFIWLLTIYANGRTSFKSLSCLWPTVLIFPFIQNTQFVAYLGLILPSITYTISYSLSLVFFLLFLFPFYQQALHGRSMLQSNWMRLLWIGLSIFIVLNGPLVPPLVLIILPSILFFWWLRSLDFSNHQGIITNLWKGVLKMPRGLTIIGLLTILFSLYSFYLGTYNVDNVTIPLSERYQIMGQGLLKHLTTKLAFPLLLGFCILNTFLLSKIKDKEAQFKYGLFKGIAVLSMIYILLLPFGGYRAYRPLIISYDTMMPISIALIFCFSSSSRYLILAYQNRAKKLFLAGISFVLIYFMVVDHPNFGKHDCEKEMLTLISQATTKEVMISRSCSVMTWDPTTNKYESTYNCALLQLWGITDVVEFYYNEKE